MPLAHSPLIERLSRVLAARKLSINANGSDASAAGEVDRCWPDYRADALAILHELREPDPAMAEVGDADVWRAMVEAALDRA